MRQQPVSCGRDGEAQQTLLPAVQARRSSVCTCQLRYIAQTSNIKCEHDLRIWVHTTASISSFREEARQQDSSQHPQ